MSFQRCCNHRFVEGHERCIRVCIDSCCTVKTLAQHLFQPALDVKRIVGVRHEIPTDMRGRYGFDGRRDFDPAASVLVRSDNDRIVAESIAHLLNGVRHRIREKGSQPHARRLFLDHTVPTVRSLMRGWISFCDITNVCGRNRSMIERT